VYRKLLKFILKCQDLRVVTLEVVKWMNFPSSLPSSETDVIGESDSRDTLRVVSCTSKLVDGFSSGVGIGRAGRD